MSGHAYKVGDTCYLQSEGGPIGLELTGAISRPFMMKWDKLYMAKLSKAGVTMMMFKRYVDDSNQVVKRIPAGRKFDDNSGKLVVDNQFIDENMEDDKIAALVLKEIANTVIDGIQLEADFPSNSENRKMAILDMEVWIGEGGNVLYQHYEKTVASKAVLHAQSGRYLSAKQSCV